MNFSASTFAEMGHGLQPEALDENASRTRSLLVFHLGERAYGLAVEHVAQIIAMLKLTPVPQAEQAIEGVANIRGKIVPVISARRHLGLPQVKPHLYTPIILLNTGERTIGLIVDEVADVIRLPASEMTSPSAILPQGSEEGASVLEGVVHHGDSVIMVINPGCLLSPNQMRSFRRAVHNLPETAVTSVAEAGAAPLPVEPAARSNGSTQQEVESRSTTSAQAPDQPAGKKSTAGNGRGKSRKGRRNFDEKLAGEIAGLAADLPPSEGELPFGDELDPGASPFSDDNLPA